ncbi:MAG: ABC transporter permease [Candidatus Omnitrophota bacterium]
MKKVWTIFRKELKDTLRDRRTIFMMIVMPLVLMYGLMSLIVSLQMGQHKKAEEKVLTIGLISRGNAEAFRSILRQRTDMKVQENIDVDRIGDLISQNKLDFAVVFDKNFDQNVQDRKSGEVDFYFKSSSEVSITKERVKKLLEDYKKTLLDKRLEDLKLDESFLTPVKINEIEKATIKEQIGEAAGGFLPYFFVIFCFLGAMYPAIDLAAGEKERSTIETLLTSPVSRLQIVMGKFLVVFLSGITSAVISLLGIYMSIKKLQGASKGSIDMILRLVEVKSIALLFSLLIPLCVFLAAALLSLSIFAKSFKEAQSIISPLNIVILVPILIGMIPGIKLNSTTALIPILNISLAAKEIVAGTIRMGLLAEVYASMFILAAFSLWFCTMWFKREDVIFRGI